MNTPKEKQGSGANDNLMTFQPKTRDESAFDPSVFDQFIQTNLKREESSDENSNDHPICHLY